MTRQSKTTNSTQDCRVAILVVGMHRSGTSAVTGTLGKLGVAMPNTPLGANEYNPTGYWESEPLVQLNDRMLADGGSRWDDWRPFDPAALGAEALNRYKVEIGTRISQEFGSAPLFALKDPRICRLIPIYEEVLGRLGVDHRYLLVHRNPLAVIASHGRRDEITSRFAELMWLRHVVDAEFATRGRLRSIQSYEDILHDWRSAASRMAKEMNINWPCPIEQSERSVDQLLSTEHTHHAFDPSLVAASSDVGCLAKDAYQALRALSLDEGDDRARSTLDEIKNEVDAASSVLGDAAFHELASREKRLSGLAANRQHHIDRLTAESREKDRTISALQAELEKMKSSTSWRLTRPVRAVGAKLRTMEPQPQ